MTTDILFLISTSFLAKLAVYSLWLVPVGYALAFFLPWIMPDKSRYLSALALLFHIAVWTVYTASTTATAPPVSAGWSMLALSLVIAPLLLDRKNQMLEWLHTNVLLAALATLLWVFLATSQIPFTAKPRLEIFSWLLLFVGTGFLLSHSMMAWQIHALLTAEQTSEPTAPPFEIMHHTQLLAAATLTLSLILLVFQGWSSSFHHLGTLLICFLNYSSLLFPTVVSTRHTSTSATTSVCLSPAFLGWSKLSGIVALLWLFFQIILIA